MIRRKFGKKFLVLLVVVATVGIVPHLLPQKLFLSIKKKFIGWGDITYHQRGYWAGEHLAEYHSDHFSPLLAKRLAHFFQAEDADSVVDLGGGAGLYVTALIQSGIWAICIDGNPESQDISNGVCATMDLTKPINLPSFDWVLSLSVGRQIPPPLEDSFIANLHALNNKGIVLFWGDGRRDYSKIQLKSILNTDQVSLKFQELSYIVDEKASNFLRDHPPRQFDLLVLRKTGERKNSTLAKLKMPSEKSEEADGLISLAVTACGMEKMKEALVLIKSAIIFSQHTSLRVFIFSDEETSSVLKLELEKLERDSKIVHSNFKFEVHPISFPPVKNGTVPWSQVFRSCSLQRLFIPSLLPEVDALIYFDADSLILSNLTQFWAHFDSMTKSEFIGVTAITEGTTKSWFQKHAVFPHYGERGLNTGIALMNLTRMRLQNFENLIVKVRDNYENVRPKESGDQFLQNILYSFYPEFVSVIPCDWNLRRLHCSCKFPEECACKSALKNGVAIVHGTKNTFSHPTRLPYFKHIFEAIRDYDFMEDDILKLFEKLTAQFHLENDTCFFNSSQTFYRKGLDYAKTLTSI